MRLRNRKIRAVVLSLPVLFVAGAAVWGGVWYHSRGARPADLLERLPTSDAVIVYADFDALRHSELFRLLEGSKVAEEREYQDFVQQSGFDYKRDLDSVLLAVAPSGKYLLVRGSFNWKKLERYVESQNGRCERSFCRLQGSTPDRRISFFPVQSGLMALAVSPDDSAALRMSTPSGRAAPQVQPAPLWISIPASVLQSGENLPAEAQTFARTLAHAESVILSLVPQNTGLRAELSVRCRSAEDAMDLARQLTRLTSLLRQTFENEHQTPNPADLTGVLAAGSFRQEGSRVSGSWPIERAFVRNLLGAEN